MRPNTRTLFLESPTNPTLDVIDNRRGGANRACGRATWSSTTCSRHRCGNRRSLSAPTAVVYSATKHIDGQGRCLGGVILAAKKFIDDHIHQLLRQTGPCMSPFNAWVMLKGLETLSVRVRRQTTPRRPSRSRCSIIARSPA